jgi:hypothetical protein
MLHIRGAFAKFMYSPYYSMLELCGDVVIDGPIFEAPPLAVNAPHTS